MEAVKYTLYIAGGTVDSIEPILTKHGLNATLTPVHGVFNGVLEYGTKVEVVEFKPMPRNIPAELVLELKEVLKQDSIMLTTETIQAKYI